MEFILTRYPEVALATPRSIGFMLSPAFAGFEPFQNAGSVGGKARALAHSHSYDEIDLLTQQRYAKTNNHLSISIAQMVLPPNINQHVGYVRSCI